MKNALRLAVVAALLALFALGCSSDSNPVVPEDTAYVADMPTLAALAIPANATLDSAILHLYVSEANQQTVNVHRITAAWEETEVTWNSFGQAYASEIEGSFSADTVGWVTADITDLVAGWLSGEYSNFGLLLDQVDEVYPRARYNTREHTRYHPYLELCYTTAEGPACEAEETIADTYIWKHYPTLNNGTKTYMYTGWLDDTSLEKQSLILFDLEVTPPTEGCTRTIGYWKNHSGMRRWQADEISPLLPVWLGTAGGDKSLEVTTAIMAVRVLKMKTFGRPANGITKLYAQLLAAKLNIAAGADGTVIAETIADADAFLAEHNWQEWWRLRKPARCRILSWKDKLDAYNNGRIGPGHCD